MRYVSISIAVVVALAVLGTGPAFAGDAAKGKQTFLRVGCFECHGTQGQGGLGPKLSAPVPLAEDALHQFVRNTSGDMPAYSVKVLSEAELSDIYAYLQSIPKPSDPNSIPLLK